MARRRPKTSPTSRVQRDNPSIARDTALLDSILEPVRHRPPLHDPLFDDPLDDLRVLEDRRTWHPSPYTRPPRALDGRRSVHFVHPGTTLPARPLRAFGAPLSSRTVAFDHPRGVLVCVRRAQRRQVLFASRRTGRGSRSPRRRSTWSDVSCK